MKLSIFILDENSQSLQKSDRPTQTWTGHFRWIRPQFEENGPDQSYSYFWLNNSTATLVRTPRKILNKVALIPEIKGFGYTPHDDVKDRFDSCMMKGKYEEICNLICRKIATISASDHGTEYDLANKCYKCRGRQGSAHKSWPFLWPIFSVRLKVEQKIYFRWTGEAGRVLSTKTIFKWVLLELKKCG